MATVNTWDDVAKRTCKVCGYVAKTRFGIGPHMKKHKNGRRRKNNFVEGAMARADNAIELQHKVRQQAQMNFCRNCGYHLKAHRQAFELAQMKELRDA